MSIYRRMVACGRKQGYDEGELLDIELDDEEELGHLEKEYKICDKQQWAILNGTDGNKDTAKMQKVVKIFRKENEILKLDVKIATSEQKKKKDIETAIKIKQLVRDCNQLDDKIKETKAENSGLQQQMRVTEKNIKKLKTLKVTQEKHQKNSLQIERLEKKLENQNKKIGLITEDNRKLKQQIISLLNQRNNFNTSWERLISKLYKGKKVLMDLIQQSTVAYNARDEYIQKLNFLRSRAINDFTKDKESYSKLEQNFEDQYKLSDFIKTKQTRRRTNHLQQNIKMTKKSNRTSLKLKFVRYINILDAVKDLTPQRFLTQDNTNFSMWNLIFGLYNQIGVIEQDIRQMHSKIKLLIAERDAKSKNHKQLMVNLKNELKRFSEDRKAAESKLEEQNIKLKEIFEKIWDLFAKAECDNTPFTGLLLDNSRPNNYNVILYLEAIEDQFRKYILTAFYKQQFTSIRNSQGTIIKVEKVPFENVQVYDYVPTNPCPLCVESEMVHDVIDTMQFSFTRTEVKKQLEERLQLPDGTGRLHTVSKCNLPKSREIIRKRYQ